LVSLFLVVLLGAYVGWSSFVVPRHALAGTLSAEAPHLAGTATALTWPATGQAAVGAVGYGVLARHNTATTLPTASVTKLITALCVLQKHPLQPGEAGPTITISQQDVDSYNYYLANHGSLIAVRVGQRLSERQAIEAMLLRSANNMADTLARWAYGSLPAYATFANSYVASHGLADTHVGTDASGFDPSTVSTASDLVKLGEIVMQQPVLSTIVGEKSVAIPESGTVRNTNNLLGQHGIVGIKTGNNDQDPGAYLLAAKYQTQGHTVTIVGAVMGAHNISAAKQAGVQLLLSAQPNFTTRTIVAKGQTVGTYRVPWASPVAITADQDLTVFGWRGTPLSTTISLKRIVSAITPGQTVGTITSGTATASVSLPHAVAAPPLSWRLKHPLE